MPDRMLQFKVVVNCGPCADFVGQCLDSIRTQSYPHWEAYVTIDPCGDETAKRARAAGRGEPRLLIHRNRVRRYSLYNLVRATARSGDDPEDVIVCLDGDDWFSTPDALAIIADTYRRYDCWMTYGSWQSNVVGHGGHRDGCWPAYPEGTTRFRHTRWLGTAVRTWKRWLWGLLRDADLRTEDGRYFRVSEDQVVMLPLLEMCGTDRARHVATPIMVYNKIPKYTVDEDLAREKERNGDLISQRPPYARLKAPVRDRSVAV
jgi:glycosyltransferase involved in cell wall biosynthesis